MKKRMAIFVFYDKDNVVDEYVYFMLKEIKKVVDYLVAVVNGKLVELDEQRMAKYADDVFQRKNIGYDAGAIKDVILNFVGIEKIVKFDELLIINDTLYGPLYPLTDVFRKMENKAIDFWGLTYIEEVYNSFRYLQSCFLVIRKNMLCSAGFLEYWEKMKYYEKFEDVLCFYEQKFTEFFSSMGYKWDSYLDMKCTGISWKKIYTYPYYNSFEEALYAINALPFIKRKPMVEKMLFKSNTYDNVFESYIESISSLKSNNFFDFNMVWDNLLRVYPLNKIQKSCNLNYIFSSEETTEKTGFLEDVLIVIDLQSEIFLDKIINKINNLYNISDFLIFLPKSLKKYLLKYKKHNVHIVVENITENEKIFVIDKFSKNYQYICYINTIDFDTHNTEYIEKKARFLCYFENMIKSGIYISHIRKKLKKDIRLGMLFPPKLFEQQVLREESFFEGVHSFWIKKEILVEFIENYKLSNVNIPEKLAKYAQVKGYYSGVVKSDKYAVIDAEMKEEYLFDLIKILKKIMEKICIMS